MDMTQIEQSLISQMTQLNGISEGQIQSLMSSGTSFADIIQMMLSVTQDGGEFPGGDAVSSEYGEILSALTENLMAAQSGEEQQYYPVIPQNNTDSENFVPGMKTSFSGTEKNDVKISDFSEDMVSADPVQLSGLLGVVMTGNSVPENNGIISTIYNQMPVNTSEISIDKVSAYDIVNKYIESGELEIIGFTPKLAETVRQENSESMVADDSVGDVLGFYRTMQNAKETIPAVKSEMAEPLEASELIRMAETARMPETLKMSEPVKTVEPVKTEVKTAEPVKTEEKAEVKTAEPVKTEEKAEVKTAESVKTEEKAEVKTAEPVKTEEKAEVKTAEPVKTEEKAEVKTAEPVKTEEKAEVKTAEPVKTEEKAEVKTAEPVKTEEKAEVKTAEPVKTEEKAEVKTAEPVKTEEKAEVKTAEPVKTEEKAEVKTAEPVKTEEKAEVKTAEPVKTEEKAEVKTDEPVKTEVKAEVETDEPVKTEEKAEVETAEPAKTEEPVKTEVKTVETVETAESVKTEVKTVETVKTAESVKTEVKTVETVKTAETAKPVETAEPVKASEPVRTAENTEPAETVEAAESVKRAETVKPAEPVKATESVKKAETVKPAEPVRESGHVNRTETAQTAETVKASEPVKTAKTAETSEPVEFDVLQNSAAPLDIRFERISSEIKMKEEFEPPHEQLLKGVEENLKKGNSEFIVKLRPEGLGEIIVKLVQNDGGKMFMSMTASSIKTAELLNSNLSSLQSSLSQHNVEIVKPSDMPEQVMPMSPAFEQYYGQSDGGQQNRQNQQFYNRNHGFITYSNTDNDEVFSEKAAAAVGQSGLNIVI